MHKSAFTDGWRGRIGLVATAPGNSTEAEFNRYRPEGVAILTTRTPLVSSTVEGIRKMNTYIEDAALMLAQNAYCDVVLLSSTAGSFIEGPEYDEELSLRLSKLTGKKVITSCQCMLKALSAINASSVTLISPSSSGLNEAEKNYLYKCGTNVVSECGFLLDDPRDILCISPEDVYSLVRATDSSASEAILISCSGLHVMQIIATLEKDLGKPVLTSNQFGLWGALQSLGVRERLSGIGSLFNY